MADTEPDLSAPELTRDQFLERKDPRFDPDNVAIVTGAASGIGRTTAVALAINGLTVVGADIDEDGLESTRDVAEDLNASGAVFGAIGNMSSVHGHYATRDKAAYITAKHGLSGLTRAVAAEGDGTLRGFSEHARHLNGGDLLWDGGYTTTYE